MIEGRDVGFLPEEQVWPRLDGRTPYELRSSPSKYPLEELLAAAFRVGGPADQLDSMTRGLSSDEPGVRYWSAMAIGSLGHHANPAREKLVAALNDPSAAVRIEAAYALARIGAPQRALPVLVELLEDERADVVLHAARAIELLGPLAREAAEPMRRARQRAEAPGTIEMFIRFSADAFLKQENEATRRR